MNYGHIGRFEGGHGSYGGRHELLCFPTTLVLWGKLVVCTPVSMGTADFGVGALRRVFVPQSRTFF